MINKDIRKKLIETKQRKETLLIEQEIVKNRVLFIFENEYNIKNFNKLPKRKRLELSVELFSEIYNLQKNNLLSEQFNLWGILKTLFGGFLGRSAVETIAEPLIDKILSAVGFKSEGILKKAMISFLTTNPTDLIAAFGDCKKMSNLLMESFTEGFVMLMQDQTDKDSFMYDYIRNVLGGKIKDWGGTNLENMISEKVCGLFSNFGENAKNVISKLSDVKSQGT